MKDHYDIVFITTIPAFYKVNLFNAISKHCKIMVFYTGSNTGLRSRDFIGEDKNYNSFSLSRNATVASKQILSFLQNNQIERVIVSGWDTIVSFVACFLNKKRRNECIVESSFFESSTTGIKAFVKKLLLKRVSTVYVPGEDQKALLLKLDYKGKIIETGGCGLLNYVQQPLYTPRKCVQSFLYVGQLIEKKGVALLVALFNRHPEWQLTIIGDGLLREELEREASSNIRLLGAVNNRDLPDYYKKADVFILPSRIEPWGLVVEESLNNGTPVIISDHVGCVNSLVIPNEMGLVFKSGDEYSLESCIDRMRDIHLYNLLRKNVSLLDFNARAKQQVEAFL